MLWWSRSLRSHPVVCFETMNRKKACPPQLAWDMTTALCLFIFWAFASRWFTHIPMHMQVQDWCLQLLMGPDICVGYEGRNWQKHVQMSQFRWVTNVQVQAIGHIRIVANTSKKEGADANFGQIWRLHKHFNLVAVCLRQKEVAWTLFVTLVFL